jgi:hypothetical protein
MQLPRPSSFSSLLTVCLACLALASPVRSDDPAANEIMELSSKAMAPPIQYTMESGGSCVLISQKVLADGSTVSRTDSEIPVKKYSLRLPGNTFDIYPNHGVLIDLEFMSDHSKAIKDQTQKAVTAFGDVDRETTSLVGMINESGKECFEIETRINHGFQQAISHMFGADISLVPARQRFLIAKDTYELIATEQISASGDLISRSAFSKFVHAPDLADEMFLPPDGMEVQKPKSMEEYLGAIKLLFALPKDAAIGRSAEILRENARQVALINQRHEEEASAIAAGVSHSVIKLSDLPPSTINARMRLLYFNLILLAVIALAVYLKTRSLKHPR